MSLVRWILAALLLLATAQGAFFFLVKCRVSFLAWITFNACAVANLTFLAGVAVMLLFKTRLVMYAAVLPLFFFGGGGLVVFPWSGYNLIAQASHLIMTLNLVLLLEDFVRQRDWQAGALGLLLGILLYAPFIAFQQHWVHDHQEQFQDVMNFTPGPPAVSGMKTND